MTLSDLARILRHSDFKDRLRHVDCDRRTIHLGSSFHRGLWTQGDFGTSMPFKSREESIPSSFGAIGEARHAAIAARSTFFRRTHPRWLLRASVDRWDGLHQVLPTRGDCPRKKLSSGNCSRHAPSDAEPQRLSLGSRKPRGLGLLHGRRLSQGCATLGSNFWDTALGRRRGLLPRLLSSTDFDLDSLLCKSLLTLSFFLFAGCSNSFELL